MQVMGFAHTRQVWICVLSRTSLASELKWCQWSKYWYSLSGRLGDSDGRRWVWGLCLWSADSAGAYAWFDCLRRFRGYRGHYRRVSWPLHPNCTTPFLLHKKRRVHAHLKMIFHLMCDRHSFRQTSKKIIERPYMSYQVESLMSLFSFKISPRMCMQVLVPSSTI